MTRISKEQVEAKLMLAEFLAEVYGKVFNEQVIGVITLYQKGGKSYNEKELEERVGRESMEKALSTQIIRKVNSNYELTDIGERISEHILDLSIDILSLEKLLSPFSEDRFREYKELARKYISMLKNKQE